MSKDMLNEDGLTLKTLTEIRSELEEGYKEIYGQDIDLGSHTQDGQLLNIFAQMNVDLRELIREVYNTLTPSYCRGSVQDIRYAINHLKRKGGTFTIVPMTVVVDSTVKLQGLDADYNDVLASAYGAADDSGNNYYLIDSVTLTAGTHILPFRAQNIGYSLPIVGTITNPITIVKGVKSVINESAPTSIGEDQESDEAYAIRRERSPEYRAQNNADAMRAQLLELDGVSDAYVYSHDFKNYPEGEDADGILPHYLWPIVEGGSNADIAVVLYANCGGAGLKGEVEVDTVTASGRIFTTYFDRSEAHPLYIKFDLQEIVEGTDFDIEGIKSYIAQNLIYQINELAETSKPTEIARMALEANGGNGVAINLEISEDGEHYVDYIPSPSKKAIFTVDASRISITEINL